VRIPEYCEPVYLEGGPWNMDSWIRGCRADSVLIRPLDVLITYAGGYRCEYVRTDRIWRSPLYRKSYTIFQFTREL
jgi:hypothetical protein